LETKTADASQNGDYSSANHDANKNKNRYQNVLPIESTRVLLKAGSEEGSDYINANYVDGLIPGTEKCYIAAQGPTGSTLADFWRMVWEMNVSVILMLTKEVESMKKKCEHYSPDPGVPLDFDGMKVEPDGTPMETEELAERDFKITFEGKERKVRQLQYLAWPDHGVPESTGAFLQLCKDADSWNKTHGPLVVHCSAGIGRTGTFCVVHSTLEKIRAEVAKDPQKEPTVNIIETILHLRKQRSSMVQTVEQYEFCYLAINEGVRVILKKNKNDSSSGSESRSASGSSSSSSGSESGSESGSDSGSNK